MAYSESLPVINDLSSFNITANQPQRRSAGGMKGFLERLIPAGTSVAGSVLGSLLGPAGTVAGGAIGGGLGSELESKLTGQKASAGQIAESAALGGLTGIGKGIAAVKDVADVARAGQGSGAVINALRGGAGAATRDIASSTGATVPGAAAQGLKDIGNKVLTTQVNGLRGRLLDTAPQTMQDMAQYGVPRVSQFENMASKVTGSQGVLNTVKNQIIGRAEKNGANVNLDNFGPTRLATPMGASGRLLDNFNPNLAGSDTVSNAIQEHLLTDPSQQNAIYRIGKGISQSLADSKGSPSAVFGAQKKIEGLAGAAFSAGKTEMGNALRSISNDLGNRLDAAVGKEAITQQDAQTMINGLIDNGVTNPKLLQDVKGLEGKAVPDIRAIESKFVNASHIGAATRRANLAAEGADINKGPVQGIGNVVVTRPALAVGRQVVGRGANILGGLAGKAATAAPEEGQIAGATAKQALKTQGLVRAPHILGGLTGSQSTPDLNQPATSSPDTSPNLPTASQTEQASPYPLANMLADIEADPSKSSTYMSLYKMLNPGGGNLSTSEQNSVDNLRSAATSLQTYMQQVQKAGQVGPGAAQVEGTLAGLPVLNRLVGQQGADIRGIEATRTDLASTLAKALTGSSRPAASVIQQWAASIPNVTDTPAVAQQKYQNLLQQIQSRLSVAQVPGSQNMDLSQLLGA